jgi:hypothetical protein
MIEASKTIGTEQFDRDGVPYKIDLFRATAGYWTTWTCLACHVSGVRSAARTTSDALVGAKGSLIAGHHLDAHGGLAAKRARTNQQ